MTEEGDNVGRSYRAVVLMGPAGVGKTTVGQKLARRTSATFVDADDHHPPSNIEKMRRGEALADEDRWPWLQELAKLLSVASADHKIVLACSALKTAYRTTLTRGDPMVLFMYLLVPTEELARRLTTRGGHFFDPRLLQSQLDVLEVPDEGSTLDGTLDAEDLVTLIAERAGW